MLIISYLILVFKIFLLLLSSDVIFLALKLIFGIGLIYSYFKNKYTKDNKVNVISLESLKIKNYVYTITIVTLCTMSFITTVFVFKVLNIGKQINLKLVYVNLKEWLLLANFSFLIVNCILIIGLLLIMFPLFAKVKGFVFYEFLKIHLYFIGFKPYIKLFNFVAGKKHYITQLLLWKLFNSKWETLSKSKAKTLYHYCSNIEEHLALILICISVIYDILFNGMVLSKIYYVFPLCYLYLMWRLLINFICKRAQWTDSDLHIYLYKTPSTVSEEGITYEDGSELSMDDLAEIRSYILKGFTMNTANTKIIDQFMKINKKDNTK
jgi:hypothetical protein